MTLRQISANGIEAVQLATQLLQRVRQADSLAGVFEAADIQWAWRMPRLSDDANETFWIDDRGPVAGVLLTSYPDTTWQIDPVVVPGDPGITIEPIWKHACDHIDANPGIVFHVPLNDGDALMPHLAQDAGLVPGDRDTTGWLPSDGCPRPLPLAEGFSLITREDDLDTPHPMIYRNSDQIQTRLLQCSLYDPALDFAIRAPSGETAGYSLYWFDPVTKVGLVEPVRVHDTFQRLGLARAMLSHGISELVSRGAERIKVSWESDAAGRLYTGVGFQPESSTTWYRTPPAEASV